MSVQHDRTIDHSGTQDTDTIVLSAPVGPHPAGTTLQAVLEDFITRLSSLESGDRRFASFTFDAWIRDHFWLDAVILDTQAATFTLNAVVVSSVGSFTLDAIVRGASQSFSLDAFVT